MSVNEADCEIRATIARKRADIRDIEREIKQLEEALLLLWEAHHDA